MNMARYRNLTYLVLTKRTDEAPQMILDAVGNCAEFLQSNQHIMIGGSAGNQAGADRRIAHLLSIPGNSRPWLSAEPLIGALDLTRVAEKHRAETINALHRGLEFQRELQWVVVGGESQTGARPANPAWVKKIKADCEATGTTFFFKQWGEWVPVQEIGDDLGDGMYRIKEQYKKAANGSRWGVWEGDTFCEMKSRFVVDCLAEDSMIRIGKKNDPETLDGEQYHNWPAGHYWN
jgi:protein gp37